MVEHPKKNSFLFLFLSRQSEQLSDELLLLLNSFYQYFDPIVALVNSYTIGRILHCKDKLPVGMRSSLVYEFSCAHWALKCVVSTIRELCSRVAEHVGRSSRTDNILVHHSHSSFRLHVGSKCDVDVMEDNFKVLSTSLNNLDLLILESLYIFNNSNKAKWQHQCINFAHR